MDVKEIINWIAFGILGIWAIVAIVRARMMEMEPEGQRVALWAMLPTFCLLGFGILMSSLGIGAKPVSPEIVAIWPAYSLLAIAGFVVGMCFILPLVPCEN